MQWGLCQKVSTPGRLQILLHACSLLRGWSNVIKLVYMQMVKLYVRAIRAALTVQHGCSNPHRYRVLEAAETL